MRSLQGGYVHLRFFPSLGGNFSKSKRFFIFFGTDPTTEQHDGACVALWDTSFFVGTQTRGRSYIQTSVFAVVLRKMQDSERSGNRRRRV